MTKGRENLPSPVESGQSAPSSATVQTCVNSQHLTWFFPSVFFFLFVVILISVVVLFPPNSWVQLWRIWNQQCASDKYKFNKFKISTTTTTRLFDVEIKKRYWSIHSYHDDNVSYETFVCASFFFRGWLETWLNSLLVIFFFLLKKNLEKFNDAI